MGHIGENIAAWNIWDFPAYVFLKDFYGVTTYILSRLYTLNLILWSPKYIKNSHNSTTGRQTTQLKNGQRTWTDTSPRRTYRGPRDMKRRLASLPIREMQTQITMRYHLKPVRMAIINKSANNKRCRSCGEKGTLVHCWWECRLVQPLWKTVWNFLRKLKRELPFDPAIPLLGLYPKKNQSKRTYAPQCS